eukprot:GILI01010363.1.p1 GENE.GILI01010363.1~~GILI01010363.1.p1  ORF type:complete len:380 (+),score=72.66 GILI01010363.1:108-1247(+)
MSTPSKTSSLLKPSKSSPALDLSLVEGPSSFASLTSSPSISDFEISSITVDDESRHSSSMPSIHIDSLPPALIRDHAFSNQKHLKQYISSSSSYKEKETKDKDAKVPDAPATTTAFSAELRRDRRNIDLSSISVDEESLSSHKKFSFSRFIFPSHIECSDDDLVQESSCALSCVFWIAILFIYSAYTRVLCLFDIPYDCPTHISQLVLADTITDIIGKGFTIFFFSRMLKTAVMKQWYFYFISVVTIFLFGFLGEQYPGLYLEVGHSFAPNDLILFWIVLLIFICIAVYHMRIAFRIHQSVFIAYCSSFLFMIAFYALKFWFLYDVAVFHMHHAHLFWILSWFCRFKDPVSKASLAVCVGIFIQGTAVYGSGAKEFSPK